ncbi:MAG TPA: helix-turn-helix domain-containing protein [candidate division Zixibacteria bacterium]|nr:helix-turn-helix domain-containing protein [candidate division Zixibacteria bacterium]
MGEQGNNKIVPLRRTRSDDPAAAANPFAPFFEEIRRIVREEIQAAMNGGAERLLTAEEAAKLIGCSPDYLYRRAKSLPFVRRIGRMVRFSQRGILAYLEAKSPTGRPKSS